MPEKPDPKHDPTKPLDPKDKPPRDTHDAPAPNPDDEVKGQREIDERELARQVHHRKN